MSQRHEQALRTIRLEYDHVVTALRRASGDKKRGAPGKPSYDPSRLEIAIASAGDAYALLLIATAEGFLREYLLSVGIDLGNEPKLSNLIDKSVKEFNLRTSSVKLRPTDKVGMHDLRINRNEYAHGHGRSVFPSVPRVESTISKFTSRFREDPVKRRRPIVLAVGIGVPVAVLTLIVVGEFNRGDDFQFLHSKSPFVSGVWLSLHGDGFYEYRVYSRRQNYWTVRAEASKELRSKGFDYVVHDWSYDMWKQLQTADVAMGPGRSRSRREGLAGKRTYDPTWVTVVVERRISDSAYAHLRYALEPRDY